MHNLNFISVKIQPLRTKSLNTYKNFRISSINHVFTIVSKGYAKVF
jgi:hypothetical protein